MIKIIKNKEKMYVNTNKFLFKWSVKNLRFKCRNECTHPDKGYRFDEAFTHFKSCP